jgi:putative sterol carrier protein
VTLTEDRSTAVAVARGERSAQEAFMDGEVRVGGDIGELLAAQAALARLGDVFASVRADTDFGA